MTARKKIWVIAEAVQGEISSFFSGMVAAAEKIRELSTDTDPEIMILVAGRSPGEPAKQAAALTGYNTICVRFPTEITPEALKQGLVCMFTHRVQEQMPDLILFSHTTMGREVAPGLGARFNAPVFSGVTDIQNPGRGLMFYRQVLDNSRVLCLGPALDTEHGLSLLTLVPDAFGDTLSCPGRQGGRIDEIELTRDCLELTVRRLGMTTRPGGNEAISQAKIVVGAGRGIGGRENLENIEAFAATLPGACTGASRPLVDQGWMPYSRQVGITGATVRPDLYIACGISGASQHLSGMAGSKWVVSINNNLQAPICRHSDLCIQADVNEFIDAYLKGE